MAASLAGVLIGADVTAMPVAASSKGVDAGKLFAMSFSAQIGSTASAEIGAALGQVKTGHAPTNGVAEKANAEGDTDVGKALIVPMPPEVAGQSTVVQKNANGVVSSNAKTVMPGASTQKADVPQVAPSRSVETPDTTTRTFASDAKVVLDGPQDVLNELGTAVMTDMQSQIPASEPEQVGEATAHEDTTVPGSLPLKTAAQDRKTVAASCSVEGALREHTASFGTMFVPENSVGDATSVKKSAKKQGDARDSASLKTTDAPNGSAAIAGSNSFVSVPLSGQVVVVSTLCAAATQDISDCQPQVVSQAVVKSVSGYAVPVNQKSASAITADSDRGSARQVVAGAAPKAVQGSEPVLTQKSDSVVKASGPVNFAMSAIVAKPQSGDGVVSSAHLTASATVGAVNVAASNPVIHPGVTVSQKGVGADVSASLMLGHADHGEASGVQMQTMDGGHRTLVATPTVLEVGIPNGTQGWLKVRAELAGGGVNASMSAASSAGQEMLHRELPALTSYLQQEKVAVNSVVVHAPAGDVLRGISSGVGGGAGGQMQGQGQGRGGRQPPVMAGQSFFEGAHVSESDEVVASVQNLRGGGWLSVRA